VSGQAVGAHPLRITAVLPATNALRHQRVNPSTDKRRKVGLKAQSRRTERRTRGAPS